MKKLIIVALTLIIGSTQVVFAQSLAERRALKEYQESVLPDLQNQINSSAGFEVPLNIKWAEIAQPGEEENYSNDAYFTNVYFTPLVKALSSITSDALGKEALKAKLKGINIGYDPKTAPSSAYENGVNFKDGQLSLNFKPFSNASDIDARAQAIINLLESKL